MHYIYAFITTYILNIFFIVNNSAVNLSYAHRKRELNFNNYPGNRPGDNNNYYQQKSINDPGYTAQNENNNNDKTSFFDRTANITSPQNYVELINPKGQIFNLLYMTPHPNKIQQMSTNVNSMTYHTQFNHHTQPINSNIQNLVYAGPHLFPSQNSNKYQNMQQSNLPIKNINTPLHNVYPAQLLLRQKQQNYMKESNVPTKMEAPFIPSQFLGYGQYQNQQLNQQQQQQQLPQQQFAQQYEGIAEDHQQIPQQLPQQSQPLPQQYQQLPQQNQQLTQQPNRTPFKMTLNAGIKPVHEQHQFPPQQPSNFIYMAPNSVYDLYKKSN